MIGRKILSGHALDKRDLRVVQMLDDGIPWRKIMTETGASSAVISKLKRECAE